MDFLGGNSSFSATTQYITGTVKSDNPLLAATILVLVSLGAAFTIYSVIDRTRLDGKVKKGPGLLRSLWIFCYSCFPKPHEGNNDGSQQGALERFYKSQAKIYDTTRRVLLKGRADMLSLAAAQLKHRATLTTGTEPRKQIWIDVCFSLPVT
jgi:betaine lipid synthase